MNPKSSFTTTLAVLIFAGGIYAAEAATKRLTPETKVDTTIVYSAGDYGLDRTTTVWVAMVSPTLETETWRFQASLPYLRLDGPATAVGNVGGATDEKRDESGLGDVSVSLTRKINLAAHGWLLEFGGRGKLPTADEARGLGTGKADGSFQVDAYKVGSELTPFASAGYQVLGESEVYPMKSGPFASLGIVYPITPATSVGAIASWKARMIQDGEASADVMVFMQWTMYPRASLQCFVMKGFTEATPDICLGLTAGIKL